jgi:hypothetical protein
VAEWQPVTEALPKPEEEVILFCPADPAQRLAAHQFIGYRWMEGFARATHWMPKLPDPCGVSVAGAPCRYPNCSCPNRASDGMPDCGARGVKGTLKESGNG